MTWKHKTYRCEWQVQYGEVDQYGQNFKPYRVTSFPTREEALAWRELRATLNPFNHEWVPNDAPHGYCRTEVNYREVEV